MDQADVKARVGTALRAALRAANVSQSTLARGIGRPPGTVSAWVNGTNLVSLADVAAVDEYLGGHLLDDAGLTKARTVLEALNSDEALDDEALDDMRAAYERAITATARRRVAEVARDGDTTGSGFTVDEKATTPAGVLLLQLFGRDKLRELVDELASAVS